MPTYEYQCGACGHRFEQFQSIKADPLKKCPSCGKPKLERLIGTGAAVLFKGSGFYETDYRSESYKKAAEADKPAAASESKADAKPADATKKDAPVKAEAPKADAKPAKPEPAKPSKPEPKGKKKAG
jgi:putative FmdB family regulatory protein